MGFALWLEDEVAVAQGTHEYRPMGWAVIARTGVFSPKDFHPWVVERSRRDRNFVGLFASLGEVNAYLRRMRSQAKRKKIRSTSRRLLSVI